MSDVIALRTALDAARLRRDSALAEAGDHAVALERLRAHVAAGTFTNPPHPHDPQSFLDFKEAEQSRRNEAVFAAEDVLESLAGDLAAELDAGAPLFGARSAEPIALLPVRIETKFADARTIKVRVYPDDIHVVGFDRGLTPTELRLGRRYWKDPDAEAWQRLVARLSPMRAAWVAHATRPGAKEPKARDAQARRPPTAPALPSRWRFLGMTDGRIVADRTGRDVTDPLPLGLLAADEEADDHEHAEWAVSFKRAERAGMATTLTLPEDVDHLDQLLVVGVQDAPVAKAAKRLRDTLLGHAFGAGLGFLAPGTPTNNTPQTRSAWSSRPVPSPPPAEPPALAPGTDAARLASALGVPSAGFLAACPGAGDRTEQAVAGLSLLSWGSLGQGFVDTAITLHPLDDDQSGTLDPRPWRHIRDHLAAHVRSRGPLPTLRVGRQPYGVLPVSSVDEWRPDDPESIEAMMLPWLLRLRHHWRAALAPGWIPRVTSAKPADRVAVDIFSRLPVAIDLMVRRVLSPNLSLAKMPFPSPGPVLSVGGIDARSGLRWSVPTELTSNLAWTGNTSKPDYGLVMPRLAPNPETYTAVLKASRRRMRDALAVVKGTLSATDFEARWPMERPERTEPPAPHPDTIFAFLSGEPEFVLALLDVQNWSMFALGDESLDDPLRQALSLPGTVDGLVGQMLDAEAGGGDPQLLRDTRKTAKKGAVQAQRVIDAIAAIERVPPEQLAPLVLEVLDVFSHRLDAWITSLPTRRLAKMRGRGDEGIRLGGYGWVEDLHRTERESLDIGEASGPVSVSPADGYVHAPSLHHAATAAVLRSGFVAHDGADTLAVDLTSRRARIARWLLGGVRRGQDLGTLLGYRFERALLDAGDGLDAILVDVRRQYPRPTAPEPGGDAAAPSLWARSSEAIAARNVVDGLALARDAARAVERFPAAREQIMDAVDALDAVSDLLLAESVHQLVGGNAMRAGIAADTLGAGETLPDRFDVLRTPHRGRAVTHRIGAALAADASPPDGWAADTLAKLEPRVEAWAAHVLGPAAAHRLRGSLRTADGAETTFDVTLEQVGLGALTTALEAASAEHARLDRRVAKVAGAPHAAVRYDAEGWRNLRGLSTRIRRLLSTAQPLLPHHVAAAERTGKVSVDLEEVRARVTRFSRQGAAAGPKMARIAALAAEPLDTAWLSRVTVAVSDELGTTLPLVPLLTGEAPASPSARGELVAEWTHRHAAIREQVRAWHETMLLAGAMSGAQWSLSAHQDEAAGGWIGAEFAGNRRPAARQSLVLHQVAPVRADAPFAGLVFDEWVEVVPGADVLTETDPGAGDAVPRESELTGLSLHFDRPDAKAPQAVLLAIAPDPVRGWTADGLALVVRDTLELAKLRAADLGDLPLLDDILPAIRIPRFGPVSAKVSPFWFELAE